MKIAFNEFASMQRELKTEMQEAFTRVYESSWYIEGKEKERSEERRVGKEC